VIASSGFPKRRGDGSRVFLVAASRERPLAARTRDRLQNGDVEMKRVTRHVVYASERDGDYSTWRAHWTTQGYDLMALNIHEPDPEDGRSGPAFELQGPLMTS
jgi:hypothetical protein